MNIKQDRLYRRQILKEMRPLKSRRTIYYKHILRIEVAYTNCLTSSSNIYMGKTLVFDFSTLSSYLSTSRKPYYSSGFVRDIIAVTSGSPQGSPQTPLRWLLVTY